MTADQDLWDDLFHACAWDAFLVQARAVQGWPDPEATRRLAYHYYEEALAEKSRNPLPTSAPSANMHPRRKEGTRHVL